MMKVNIDAGNNFVIIAKDDIRMITSTPEGVWLYYKKSENGTLFTSSTLEPTELFKKIARAISCTPEQPTLFRKRYSSEGEAINNCATHTPEHQGETIPLKMMHKEAGAEKENKEQFVSISAIKSAEEEEKTLTNAERPILVNAIANAVTAAAKVTGKSIASTDFEQAVKAVRETFTKGV